jgi:preprotein translocase subunit SecB
MIELKGYKVNKLEIENTVKPGTQLKLQNQLKYNVNYLDDNKTCVGIMDLKINDANLNPFELKISMVAEFNYGPEDQKPDIHTSSFDQLFPFVRQIINTTTSFTGMPGLMIPIIKLNRSTVVINEPTENSPLN